MEQDTTTVNLNAATNFTLRVSQEDSDLPKDVPDEHIPLETTAFMAEDTDATDDEAEFRIESLDPLTLLPGATVAQQQRTRRRVLLGLALLALVGLLLAVSANAWLPLFRSANSAAIAVLPSCGSAAFLARAIPKGWRQSGPACARQIAFAPSAPNIAYACDTPSLPEPNVPVAMVVSSSQNGGHSWQSHTTAAAGVNCNLTIDPMNPQDVFLMVYDQCSSCSQYPPMSLYRTVDGGNHWSRWLLPDTQNNFTGYYWAWVGSTFYLAPIFAVSATIQRNANQTTTQTANNQALAASIGGQALVWVQQGLLAGLSQDSTIQELLGSNTTLYVVMDSLNSCVPTCLLVRTTSDNGTTWQTASLQAGDYSVTLTGTNTEGTALFGYYLPANGAEQPNVSTIYVRSSDNGATWQALPPLTGDPTTASFIEVPDGTVYAQIAETNPNSNTIIVEKLPLGAAAWMQVTQFTDNSSQLFAVGEWELAVSWNDAGHAQALWSPIFAWEPDMVRPGLQSHSA